MQQAIDTALSPCHIGGGSKEQIKSAVTYMVNRVQEAAPEIEFCEENPYR